MVNALEEAKAKQEESADDKWKKFLAKVETFKKLVWKGMDLDHKIKKNFPGLYARIHRRRRDRIERDKLRKERLDQKSLAKTSGSLVDVEGPHNPNSGRRTKRKTKANEAAKALGDDSSDSEVDLGPLSDSLNRKRKEPGPKAKEKKPPPTVESEVIMEAVDHMAGGLMTRTNSMRSVVLTEMKESKMLLYGISDVLEVINRRVSDLIVQQNQFLESG